MLLIQFVFLCDCKLFGRIPHPASHICMYGMPVGVGVEGRNLSTWSMCRKGQERVNHTTEPQIHFWIWARFFLWRTLTLISRSVLILMGRPRPKHYGHFFEKWGQTREGMGENLAYVTCPSSSLLKRAPQKAISHHCLLFGWLGF